MIKIKRISKIKSLLLPYKLYVTKDGISVESRRWHPAVFIPIFIHWWRYWKGAVARYRNYERVLGSIYVLAAPGNDAVSSKEALAGLVRYEVQDVDCGHACGWHEEYGYVPEDGCPIHDQVIF